MSCTDCVPGKYLGLAGSFGSQSCVVCPLGFAQNNTGQAFCLQCVSGSYTNELGMDICKNCVVGRASSVIARTNKCDACSKGRYQPEAGTTACLKCIPGTYQSQEGMGKCKNCVVGKASSATARTNQCNPCSNGRYQPNNGTTACLDCIPGKHQAKQQKTSCVDCGINFFTTTTARVACESCPIGQYTLANGSASCQPCSAGTFGAGCKKCPSGFFRSAEDKNLTQCQQCDTGETTETSGAASCTSCGLGTFGTINVTRECKPCPVNFFQDERKRVTCKKCMNGKVSNAKKTGCEKPVWKTTDDCSPNVQYLNDTSFNKIAWECLPCPEGAHCPSYCTYSQVQARAGYWRVPWSKHNVTFEKCLEETACLGASENQETEQQPNNKSIVVEGCAPYYKPPLCAACARGSYKDAASFKCLACYEDKNNSVWFMLLVVLATLAVIAGFTIATVKDGGEASAVDVVVLKIAVNSWIISAGASGFPLAWPPMVVTMFQVYAVASASAIGDSLSADCVLRASAMRPVQAWALTMVIMPPTVVLLWVALFGFMTACSKSKHNYFKVHLPVSVIVTLLFGHPVVTKAAVKLIACRTIAGRDFLDADFNIRCDSNEFLMWRNAVAIPLLVCFAFGVPLAYLITMYRHVQKGTLGNHRNIYGFLFSGFRTDIWWFELWNTFRKGLFTISAVLFAPAGVMMQTWAALVLLLFYVVVFSLSQPYEDLYLNHLERGALSINVLTLLLGLGLFTNDKTGRGAKSNAFAIVITVCILVLNVFFMMTVVWTYCRVSKICKSKRKELKKKELEEAAAKVALDPRRTQTVFRKHEPTIKGSLKYNAKVAVLMARAKGNADKYSESREIRLKARKQKQLISHARLSDRLKKRERRRIVNTTAVAVQAVPPPVFLSQQHRQLVEKVKSKLSGKVKTFAVLKTIFMKLDMDHSGGINKEEFAVLIKAVLKNRPKVWMLDMLWEMAWDGAPKKKEMDVNILGAWLVLHQ